MKFEKPNMESFRAGMERALAGVGPRSSSSLAEAQELIWDAREISDRKRRVAMARQALEISPDCADAHVLLAESEARNLDESITFYEQGIAAGERALGPDMFKENTVNFWGILETRPYMRALSGLAQCLHQKGRLNEAIGHFEEMLRLNPNDNQGNRDLLAACYVDAGRDSDALELLDRYPEGITASWTYTRALVLFRMEGDIARSREARRKALESNPRVPKYFSGKKRIPTPLPPTYGIGSTEEAAIYADLYLSCWKNTPGAISWLETKE